MAKGAGNYPFKVQRNIHCKKELKKTMARLAKVVLIDKYPLQERAKEDHGKIGQGSGD
jgi:hypothetical protein